MPPADAAEVALRLCDAEYPGATTIVMGGSASTGRRTPTSDIDVLLIAPSEVFERRRPSSTSEARVVHCDGERLDVFAYTADAYREWPSATSSRSVPCSPTS